MAICPNGHESVAADVCDACGPRIASSAAPGSSRVVGKHHAGGPRPAGSPDDACPWCGNPSSGQFCARCGFRVRRPFSPLSEPDLTASSQSDAGSQPDVAAGSQLPPWSQPATAPTPEAPASPQPVPEPASEDPAWLATNSRSGPTSWSAVLAPPAAPA